MLEIGKLGAKTKDGQLLSYNMGVLTVFFNNVSLKLAAYFTESRISSMPHSLSLIAFKNFKSIKDHSFPLSDFTPIVGYNNAGKSNILSGIKWLLKKSSLDFEQFTDPTQPVEISGVITGIDQSILRSLAANHRASISRYIQGDELHVKRVQPNPNDSSTNIKLYVKDWTITAPGDPWVPNPGGIDGAISALLPEPIYIGAMENAEEDVSKTKSGTTIGKLLSEIVEPIEQQHGAQVSQALQGLKNLLDADGLNRAQELLNFESAVNPKIDSFFPNVSIKAHIPTPEIKEVFKSGTIKVYENSSPLGKDVSSMGHGAQRSIQMALIRHLADSRSGARTTSARTILLIDEPELYLHPQAIEIVRESLKSLSAHGYQTIFATHSPLMVTKDDILSTIIITKSLTDGTGRRQTLHQAIHTAITDAPSQLHLMFSLTNSSQILFAEKIILSEGTTELRLFPAIFEKMSGKSLGYNKFALINQGSASNTRKSLLVLTALGLPCKAIVDLDFAFRNAETDGYLTASDTDVAACKLIFAQIASINNISLDASGLPQKNAHVTASQAYEILANDANAKVHIAALHRKMLAHNIWLWEKGCIETHLGLTAKNEAAWAIFSHSLQNNPAAQVISDFASVQNLINWLLL